MGGNVQEQSDNSSLGVSLHVSAIVLMLFYHGYFFYHGINVEKNSRLKLFLARAEAWLQLMQTHSDRSITAVQMLRNVTGVHAALAGVAALGALLIAVRMRGDVSAATVGIGLAFFSAGFICFGLCCRLVYNLEYMISLFPTDAAEKWLTVQEQQTHYQHSRTISGATGFDFPMSPPNTSFLSQLGRQRSAQSNAENSSIGLPPRRTESPAVEGTPPFGTSPVGLVTPGTPQAASLGTPQAGRHFGSIATSKVIILPEASHLKKDFNPDSNERRCRNILRSLVLLSNSGMRFTYVAYTITFMVFGPVYLFIATLASTCACFLFWDNPKAGFGRDLRH